jgi:hypothetical protein
MLDIVTQIVFGAGALIGIWLPVFAYQCAVRSIHSAGKLGVRRQLSINPASEPAVHRAPPRRLFCVFLQKIDGLRLDGAEELALIGNSETVILMAP